MIICFFFGVFFSVSSGFGAISALDGVFSTMLFMFWQGSDFMIIQGYQVNCYGVSRFFDTGRNMHYVCFWSLEGLNPDLIYLHREMP